jgi:hypothetical protein
MACTAGGRQGGGVSDANTDGAGVWHQTERLNQRYAYGRAVSDVAFARRGGGDV